MERTGVRDVRYYAAVFLIILISCGAYLNILSNGFVYDDRYEILENPWIKDIRFLPDIFFSHSWGFKYPDATSSNYHPLKFIVLSLEYLLYGSNAWGYHLTSMIVHAMNALMVFFICFALFRNIYSEETLIRPVLASLLFAVHPVNTEAVAWITGKSELFMTFFYLLAFYIFINAPEKGYGKFILSALFFLTASLFKVTAMTFPILLIIYDYSFRKGMFAGKINDRSVRQDRLKRYAPFVTAAMVFLILRTYAIGGFIPQQNNTGLNTFQIIINMVPLISDYLIMLVAPVHLNNHHVFHPVLTFLSGRMVVALGITGVFAAAVLFAGRKKRELFFSLLWIIIPLLPVLYFPAFIADSVFAERYLYIPSAGFALSLAFLARGIIRKKLFGNLTSPLLFSVSGVILALFLFQTVNRSLVWKDEYTLWADSLKNSPDSYIVYVSMGNVLHKRGQIDEAIEYYKKAIRIKPNYYEAYNSLANALYEKRRFDEAIEYYKIAIQIIPNYYEAYNNLGNALRAKGQTDEAISYYRKALEVNPNYSFAYNNLGSIMNEKGQFDEAITYFRKAIQLNPGYAFAHNNLGIAYFRKGMFDDAFREFSTAVSLNPDYADARRNLSILSSMSGAPAQKVK